MPAAQSKALRLSLLPERYGICRFAPETAIPEWGMSGPIYSITRTADELSLVCAEAAIPDGAQHEPGWRVLRLEGPFDFDQIGVLLAVLAPLARAGVSVFALSTFDTDYVLVRETGLGQACAALEHAGHDLILK